MIRTLSEAGVLYPPDYNLDNDTMVFLIKDYIKYSIADIRTDLPTPLYIDPGCTPDKEIAEIIDITGDITSHSAVNDIYKLVELVPPEKPVPAAYVRLKNNSQILVLALFYKRSGVGGKRKKPTKKRRNNRRRMTRRYRKKR